VRSSGGKIAKHVALLVVITALITLCMLYPFLPGDYDHAAGAASALAQMFGVTGLLLVPLGIAWLGYELRSSRAEVSKTKRRYFLAAALAMGSLVAMTLLFVAFAMKTLSLGALACGVWLFVAYRLAAGLKHRPAAEDSSVHPAPVYLIVLPILTLALQLLLSGPITQWSRSRAIANSAQFIRDIDTYRAEQGRYPPSLLAQWKDYYPDVIGVEKYHYTSFGDSYNLFFEQPRFLLDDIGAREWVVYNPRDEHVIFSHTSWFLLLPPEEVMGRAQGWFAVHDAGPAHWKYFLFD
jgi:hypothetical protein